MYSPTDVLNRLRDTQMRPFQTIWVCSLCDFVDYAEQRPVQCFNCGRAMNGLIITPELVKRVRAA